MVWMGKGKSKDDDGLETGGTFGRPKWKKMGWKFGKSPITVYSFLFFFLLSFVRKNTSVL